MRMIKSKLVLFAIAVVFCSCSKEKNPEGGYISRNGITLTDSVFNVSSKTFALNIDVKATGGWRATSNDVWITVDTKERNGSGKLTLTLSENTDEFYPRRGTVSLINESGIHTVVVNQESCGMLTMNVGGVKFKMIPVEHGTFLMGESAEGVNGSHVHSVTLTKDYYIGETEVTQGLWYAVMGQKPTSNGSAWSSSYGVGDNYPAYYISYEDCEQFLTKLNQMTGQNFRFPTEAEWEFAAKGGNKSKGYTYAGSNVIENVAWYTDNSGSSTHAVKTKAANELGLYDMSGNVQEWCYDWYDSYSSSAQTDPTGPTSGSDRVIRGGNWYDGAWLCRCALRIHDTPFERYDDRLGFRLAL